MISFGLELKDQKEGGLFSVAGIICWDDRRFKHLAPTAPEGPVVDQVSSALMMRQKPISATQVITNYGAAILIGAVLLVPPNTINVNLSSRALPTKAGNLTMS